MSKLSQLMGAKKKVNIGPIEIDIKPFDLDEIEEFGEFKQDSPLKDQMAVTKKLIKKVLIEAVPDATEEELSSISMEYMTEIMDAIMTVNNINKINVPPSIKK